MGVPGDLLYTKDHEWVKIEENLVTVGITFYAQSHLSDITFVDLPKSGEVFRQFDKIAIVESVKTTVEIHSPLSGEVSKVNETLASSPEVVNQSPYGQGWFLVLEVSSINEKDNLMSAGEYDRFLESID